MVVVVPDVLVEVEVDVGYRGGKEESWDKREGTCEDIARVVCGRAVAVGREEIGKEQEGCIECHCL